jgi:tripartite-type tricarboxylate transporter receptor subunit TctC
VVVVENKAGAGGNIAPTRLPRRRRDGYTIGMGNFAPLAVNAALFKSLPFDPKKLSCR